MSVRDDNEQRDSDAGRPTDPRAQIIHDRLKRYIRHYRKKRDQNRFFTIATRLFVIVAGGTITVLLGLKNAGAYETGISTTALILSAAVTAATSWDAFADHHWKWIRYRAVLHELFAVRDDFGYQTAAERPLTQTHYDETFQRLQAAVKHLDDEWTAQSMQRIKVQSKIEPHRQTHSASPGS
jgi:hypothetical protein